LKGIKEKYIPLCLQELEDSRRREEKRLTAKAKRVSVWHFFRGKRRKKKVFGILGMKWLPMQLVIMFLLNISTRLTNCGTRCSYTGSSNIKKYNIIWCLSVS